MSATHLNTWPNQDARGTITEEGMYLLCRFAVTGSADCTARVWDLDATSAHSQGTHTGHVCGLVINGDTAITYGEHDSPAMRPSALRTF